MPPDVQQEMKVKEVFELHTHDGHGVDGDSGYFQGRTFSGADGDKGSAEQSGRTQIMLGSDGSLHEYIPTRKSYEYVREPDGHFSIEKKEVIKDLPKEITQVLSKPDTFKGYTPTNPSNYN